MQQREQRIDALTFAVAERVLDRQLQLLDERDVLIERVAQRHAPARVELALEEAKSVEGRRVEQRRRLPGIGCHLPSVERAQAYCGSTAGSPACPATSWPADSGTGGAPGSRSPVNSHGARWPITWPRKRLRLPYTTQVVSTAP